MTIQRMPGSAITPGTITVTQLESSVANVINTGGGPKITAITVTNNAYTNLDDTAVSVAGGYIKITGTGFVTGCSIIIGSLVATSVSFISATEVRAQIPAQSAGTYTVYLVNPDGGVGIRVNGVNYSSMPSWTTTSPLPGGLVDSAISIQLAATSNSTVTYALQAGSTLPTGLTLSSAGLLSGTVTGITVDTTYNFTIVATDAELQDTPQAFAITITAVSLDAYYNLVSLHLKGDVATGGNLTVFSDASTNNFQLTTNGDVRGAAFSPYNTSWSVYFDGTGDNLSSSSGFVLAGDFTVECWMYRISSASGSVIISIGAEATGRIYFYVNSSNVITYGIHSVGEYSLGNMAILNSWVHIAITRVSSTITAYVNGVATGTTGTTSGSVGNSTAFYIGSTGVPNNHHYGYISNLRVVNGTAVYTANFTPSTSPLTAVTNTAVLTCNSNRFRDSSTNNFTITRNGDSRISSFSPFLETDTTTGSGYFDGTGDYLDVTNALFNPAGAFTIEFWFYPTDGATQYQGLLTSWPSGLNPAQGIIIWKSGTSGNDAEMGIGGPSTGYSQVGSFAWANCVNRWNHLVLVRNSSDSCAAFINGSRLATPITKSGAPGQTTLSVGRSFPNITNYYFQGYISNLHYVSGSSIYDPALTTISVPTVPIAKVTNTALLTLQNRAAYNTIGFQDESEYQHVITRYGNAAQGTFSPFSNAGWSNYFVANNANNVIAATAAGVAFGTEDFCQEFFLYANSYAGVWRIISYVSVSGTASMVSQLPDVNLLTIGTGAGAFNTGIALPTKIWFHLVYTRQSGRIRIFVDGVLQYNVADTTNYTTSQSVYIGGYSGYSQSWDGYISNARIIKGSIPAAYQTSSTTNGTTIFTPPTSPLTAVTGTELLTCQSNRFFDANTQTTAKIITLNGSPSIQAFSPFAPFAYDPQVHGGSAYFDGNLDYIQSPTDPAFQMGTGDYTLECWAYFTATPPYTFAPLVDLRRVSPNYVAPCLEVSNTLKLQLRDGSTGTNPLVGATTLTLNTWHHLAITRQSGTTRCFVNGVLDGTVTNTTNFNSTVGFTAGTAGDAVSSGYYFPGYLSSVRVLKGTALYTATFTPPTGPLPLLDNTSLLLNFTNAGIIDSTGKNVIETVGNAGVVTALKKYGTGSIYFDGSGDGLMASASQNIAPGSGNFTAEGWVYIPNLGNWFVLFSIGDTVNSSGICLQIGTNGRLVVVNANLYPIDVSSGAVSAATWTHLALVRSGTTVTIYVNGVSIASGTLSSTFSGRFDVGSGVWNGTYYPNSVLGYIDDFRYTRGYARYTANFTAPTKAFADQGQASIAVSALAAPTSVNYLVVAGGGGGGAGRGGGGGAGGFRTGTALSVSVGTEYTVTIGGGGAGKSSGSNGNGGAGSNSVFSTIISAGGGYGSGANTGNGGSGGSGGGAASSDSVNYTGGSGNTPAASSAGGNGAPSAPGQGNNGGGSGVLYSAGGGGGAGAVGADGTTPSGGNGGNGTSSSISGSSVTYAGGGGAGRNNGTGGSGGTGGGGAAGTGDNSPGTSGTANTGGGGGGAGGASGGTAGSGGSGIVIIAYPTTFKPLTATLGLTYTVDTQTRSGYRVYRFLGGTGSISW